MTKNSPATSSFEKSFSTDAFSYKKFLISEEKKILSDPEIEPATKKELSFQIYEELQKTNQNISKNQQNYDSTSKDGIWAFVIASFFSAAGFAFAYLLQSEA